MPPLNDFPAEFYRRLGHGLHLAQLFDYLPEAYLYVKDDRGRFVTGNQALASLHGCHSIEQLIGKTDYDFHPRHLADQYVAEDRRVMQGRAAIPNQVWLVSDSEGQLRWFVSTKIPLFGQQGDPIGIAGVMRDFQRTRTVIQPYQEMERVLATVLQNYEQKIDVSELAKLVHLSVSQFDRKFKRLFQMTPQQYILRVRLNAAAQALTSGQQSIAEIAQHNGFYDQSYFTKQFRKHMGLTPMAYRKRYRRQNGMEGRMSNRE